MLKEILNRPVGSAQVVALLCVGVAADTVCCRVAAPVPSLIAASHSALPMPTPASQ